MCTKSESNADFLSKMAAGRKNELVIFDKSDFFVLIVKI